MTDEHLRDLVRAALPPPQVDGPARDVWRRIESRLEQRPQWSYVDLGLAAAAATTLVVFPEWLWLLVYHL